MGSITTRSAPGTRHFSRAILVAAASVAMGLSVGCDNADHANEVGVREKLTAAQTAVARAGSAAGEEANKAIMEAADAASISPELRAQAKSARGQVALSEARKNVASYNVHEQTLRQAIWDMRQLISQVGTSTALAKGYTAYDPKESRAQIQKFISAAQGGPGQDQWFTDGETKLPTLSAVRQTIAGLEGQIAQKQEALQGLTQQQTAAGAEAEQATISSQAATGEKAVEEFKRAADLRKKVGDLSVQKDGVVADLEPLQKDLAVAQGNEAVLSAAIKQFQDQQVSLDTSWKSMQASTADQQKLARKISEASADVEKESRSIAQRATELPALVKASDDARNEAVKSLDDAVKYFSDAVTAAQEFQGKLKPMIDEPGNEKRPERAAWTTSLDAVDPERYKLLQAGAQFELAAIRAREATELDSLTQMKASLEATLKDAGMEASSEMTQLEFSENRKKAIAAAEEAFTKANELFSGLNAEGNRAKDIIESATVQQMLTLYAWSGVDAIAGDAAKAKEHLELANGIRKNAEDKQIVLPSLPPELGVAKTPAKPVPATGEKPAAGDGSSAAGPTTAPGKGKSILGLLKSGWSGVTGGSGKTPPTDTPPPAGGDMNK